MTWGNQAPGKNPEFTQTRVPSPTADEALQNGVNSEPKNLEHCQILRTYPGMHTPEV